MIVQTNADGFVENYALIGTVENGVEVAEPQDMGHYEANFKAYKLQDGKLVFDAEKQNEQQRTEAVVAYRQQRERECFPIINRGWLWYDTLSQEQQEELRQWYRSWLDGTDTLAVPEKPAWLK